MNKNIKNKEDIKVVNLSLLNTPKFIEYLQNRYPDMNLNFDNKNLQENIYNIEEDFMAKSSSIWKRLMIWINNFGGSLELRAIPESPQVC